MKGHVNVHKAIGGVSRVAITVCLVVLAVVFVTAYSIGSSTANPRKMRLLRSSELMLKSETQSLQQCEGRRQSLQNGDKVTVEEAIKMYEEQVAAAKESHRLEKDRVASKRSVVQQCLDEVSELRRVAFGATADNITAHLDALRAKRDDLMVQHAALTNISEVLRRKDLLVLQTALVQQLMAANKTAHRVEVCAAATVKYSVVFDLGSSGNRVHVYKYAVTPQATTTPGAARDVISEINLTEELFELNQRALSKLPDPVAEAPAALRELFDHAKAFVPVDLHDCTPVEFKATAGLRMLGPEKATKILAAIRRAYVNETFWMRGSSPVRILDGSEEGPMAWLTVNFLLGAFSTAANTASVAVIDLGGGSTQVVFEPTEDVFGRVPTHQQFTATLGSRPVRAYQHSYEGYGLHSATRELLFHIQGKSQPRPPKPTAAPATATTGTPAQGGLMDRMFGGGEHDGDDEDEVITTTTMGPLPDPVAVEAFPCFAVGYTDELGVSNTKKTEAGAPVTGPNFAACVALFRDRLLKPSGVNCTAGHCGIGSVFQPPFANFTGDIYAFSFIFDLLDVANATALAVSSDKFMAKLPDLEKIGAERCSSLTLQSIQAAQKSGSLQPAYDCMYYAYVYALLRYGYGIAEDRQLHVAKKIRSYETAWTLGASLISLA